MKFICLFVSLVLLGVLPAYADEPFCKGYDDGFKAGICYGNHMCMEPMSPICPMPSMGESGYQSGYNRGFTAGQQSERPTPPRSVIASPTNPRITAPSQNNQQIQQSLQKQVAKPQINYKPPNVMKDAQSFHQACEWASMLHNPLNADQQMQAVICITYVTGVHDAWVVAGKFASPIYGVLLCYPKSPITPGRVIDEIVRAGRASPQSKLHAAPIISLVFLGLSRFSECQTIR